MLGFEQGHQQKYISVHKQNIQKSIQTAEIKSSLTENKYFHRSFCILQEMSNIVEDIRAMKL